MSQRKPTPDILGTVLGESGPRPADTDFAAPAEPGLHRPRRWAYREVVFRDFLGLRPKMVDGEEQPGWKEAPLIRDYLNALGAEGWELAGLVENGRSEKVAYFKRPIA